MGFKSVLFWTLAVVCTFMVTTDHADAQFDASTIEQTIHDFNDTDLAKHLVDYLVKNPIVFNELKDIVIAAVPILDFDVPHGWFGKAIFPWALKHLPDLLKNDAFLGIARIFITELNRYPQDLSWFPKEVLANNDKAAALEYMVHGLFNSLDYTGMATDILRYKSVRDSFPLSSTDRELDGKCYKDTMSFIVRLFVGDDWALNTHDPYGDQQATTPNATDDSNAEIFTVEPTTYSTVTSSENGADSAVAAIVSFVAAALFAMLQFTSS